MLNIGGNAQNPNDFLCHTLSSFFLKSPRKQKLVQVNYITNDI